MKTRWAMPILGVVAALAGCVVFGTGDAALPRSRVSLDHDWRFARFGLQADGTVRPEPGAPDALAAAGFDDSAWRRLDVPHDWGIEGPFRLELAGNTGKLPWKGIGWCRLLADRGMASKRWVFTGWRRQEQM